MIFASLLIVAFFSLAIGLTVFISNTRVVINRVYGIFSVFSALWMIANAFALDSNPAHLSVDVRNTITQLIILLASLTAISFLIFAEAFNGLLGKLRFLTSILLLSSIIINSFIFTDAYTFVQGNATITGRYYGFFAMSIAMYMAVIAYVLWSAGDRKGSRPRLAQLRYLRVGYVLAVVPSFAFGGVLASFSSSDLTALSPVFLISYLVLAGIAIIRHKLFDIRFFVVRAMAYGFTLVTTTLLFLLPVIYFLTSYLKIHLQPVVFALLVFVALMLTVLYGYLRRFLDKATSKIFFRNEYNPEEFIGELNRVGASSLDLDALLNKAAGVMETNLRADYCMFLLNGTAASSQKIVGPKTLDINTEDIESIRSLMVRTGMKLIVTDYLEVEHSKLQRVLQRNNVAVLARMMNDLDDKEGLGYILFGSKLSGQQYNTRDVRTLAAITDGLVVAVQNAMRFEEVKNFSATLQEKVDSATHRLQKTNDKLKQMDETKDEFISMASHQLRTPLTSVKGYLSMVLEGDAGKLNDMQEKLLSQAFISSQRMVFLIADLLNVSRLRTGKFIIEPKLTNLADVVEGEVNQLHETALGRSVELAYEKPKTFPTLMMDETKLRQVVMNFMDNAIYYTPAGGHIEVHLKDAKDTIEFTVKDDGMGVPQHEQHHLFSKFFRAGNARKARPDGTGLGLFMAKKVVIAQGGTLIFKSKEGHGSTFGFSFSKAHLAAQPAASEQSVVNHSHLNETGWVTK